MRAAPGPGMLDQREEGGVARLWYKCRCGFQRVGGDVLDFEDMVLVRECDTCGGSFKFKCPRCGTANKTKKVRQ